MSEKDHLDAVLAAMEAVDAEPYTLEQLEKAKATTEGLPSFYNEVHVMQRPSSGPRRSGALSQSTQWRILTRVVAKKYSNAQEMRRRATLALHEAKLTVAGETYFVERAVGDDPIAPDDGWYSGTSEYAY